MIARAPGKLVLSGAYAVLEGATALVAAVDRFVLSDSSRPAEFVTEEVRAAIEANAMDRAPWFSALELREANPDGTTRKLGLGSSAAILAASMAAVLGDSSVPIATLRDRIFPLALAAHRKAQGGGSGIDVAASVYGGFLRAKIVASGALEIAPHAIPEGTVIEVFGSPVAAVTRDFIAKVRRLAEQNPSRHRALLDEVARGAEDAVRAHAPHDFVHAVSLQVDSLQQLGDEAEADIVTKEVRTLRPLARQEGASFGPSGAGGGDIALFIGQGASSPEFRRQAQELGLVPLAMTLGAEGTHLRCLGA